MKNPFQADPAAALDKTRNKLASVDDNIASLRAKRAEVLLTAEDAGAVTTIDRAIEVERANAAIYADRIKALQEECRRVTYEEREQQRKKAIATIGQKLKRREDRAVRLQEAIEEVGRIYAQLTERDEVELAWPFDRPWQGFGIDRHSLDKEIAWAIYGICKQYGVPEPHNLSLGVVGITAEGIDAVVRAQNENILTRLAVTPIHNDILDEAI